MTLIHDAALKALSLYTAMNTGHSKMTRVMIKYLNKKLNRVTGDMKEIDDA
jgi:hypothetical protein